MRMEKKESERKETKNASGHIEIWAIGRLRSLFEIDLPFQVSIWDNIHFSFSFEKTPPLQIFIWNFPKINGTVILYFFLFIIKGARELRLGYLEA